MLNEKKYFHYESSSFLKIKGTDSQKLLQGLISNDIYQINQNKGIYSSMLSPQGKFIYDFFLIKFGDCVILECKKESIDEIKTKLNQYKLRSDVEISVEKNIDSYLLQKGIKEKIKDIKLSDLIFFEDPRFFDSDIKVYCSKDEFNKINKSLMLNQTKQNEFDNLRITKIIPDFSVDTRKNESLLLELRFDDLNGINWEKGCYMGQELTAITKYRAKIKKKLYGLKIKGKINDIEKEVFFDQKEIGKITSYNDNYGIAILKIKEVELSYKKNTLLTSGDAIVTPFIPLWAK